MRMKKCACLGGKSEGGDPEGELRGRIGGGLRSLPLSESPVFKDFSKDLGGG